MEENKVLEEVYDQKEDLSDDFENFFTVAKREYDNLVSFLNEHVFKLFNEGEEFRGNTEYMKEYSLKSFDILLQYSVLQLAINDGKLIDERVEIIEGLAIHDSLPHMIEAKLPHFHWTSFTSISREEAYASLGMIYESIGGAIKDFNAKLSLHKYASGDTLESFYDCVKHFLEVVMASQGKYEEIKPEDSCLILDIIKPKFEYHEEVLDKKLHPVEDGIEFIDITYDHKKHN